MLQVGTCFLILVPHNALKNKFMPSRSLNRGSISTKTSTLWWPEWVSLPFLSRPPCHSQSAWPILSFSRMGNHKRKVKCPDQESIFLWRSAQSRNAQSRAARIQLVTNCCHIIKLMITNVVVFFVFLVYNHFHVYHLRDQFIQAFSKYLFWVTENTGIIRQRRFLFSLKQTNDFPRERPTMLGFALISLLWLEGPGEIGHLLFLRF